jgi:Phosphoribosyl transferase domain
MSGPPTPVRRLGLGYEVRAPLFLFTTDAPLKAHMGYRAAKAGDADAAIALVADLEAPLAPLVRATLSPGLIYVAPHAIEATGDKAIPGILAGVLASATGGMPEDEIVQINRVYHTGADPMERLIARPIVGGAVARGERYVLVDDVCTMGGTLAELADHIRTGGGEIAGAVVIVFASRTDRLAADPRPLNELERRYGDEIRQAFGIDPQALTTDEATYLIGFRDAYELRNRCAKAEKERARRLRAKGVEGLG